jgi:tetratricopeptide (TPR) repeat protein
MVMAMVLGAAIEARATTFSSDTVARVYANCARQRYELGDYHAALAEFEAAYAAFPTPVLLVNKAQVLRKLGRMEEAALAYKQFLDLRSGDSRLRAEVWEALDEILTELESDLTAIAREVLSLRAQADVAEAAARAELMARAHALEDRLMRVDEALTLGFGRVHLLALPTVPRT